MFIAVLVCTTDELSRTVFIIDAFVAVLVWATDELSRAAFFFGAGNFADALSFIGAKLHEDALECRVEPELSVSRIARFKIAVRSDF